MKDCYMKKKEENYGTKILKMILKKVKSMSAKDYEKLSDKVKKEIGCCYGFGLWAIGDASPMGPMDAKDGMPTLKCPECGSDANPVRPVRKVKLTKIKAKKIRK